jgi:hypothetical protein
MGAAAGRGVSSSTGRGMPLFTDSAAGGGGDGGASPGAMASPGGRGDRASELRAASQKSLGGRSFVSSQNSFRSTDGFLPPVSGGGGSGGDNSPGSGPASPMDTKLPAKNPFD